MTNKMKPMGWYATGSLNSKKHLAYSEPYQIKALCSVGLVDHPLEIRTKQKNWCPKCARAARKLGYEPERVGLYDIDISDTGSEETDYATTGWSE